ncbi:hypothetical protein H206_08793 [Candidatus Electrothrix aarhusensis]|uniref:Uncharacterized protein n=1 Tax=Candidatus Electrothrix aarhusensis TaxID=1859131 RepID=A0A444ISY4_9BACT|nr:hypothetical protein H206_08793 [Candidatus Electrothrix aarhusensis]
MLRFVRLLLCCSVMNFVSHKQRAANILNSS